MLKDKKIKSLFKEIKEHKLAVMKGIMKETGKTVIEIDPGHVDELKFLIKKNKLKVIKEYHFWANGDRVGLII